MLLLLSRLSRSVTVLVSICLLAWSGLFEPAAIAGCGGQGDARLETRASGPIVVGAEFTFRVFGRAGAPFALLADVGPGPRVLPRYGTICLDLGPRLVFLADGIQQAGARIGAGGSADVVVQLPANPNLRGRTFYAQAVILDDDAPNGLAISNQARVFVNPSFREDFSTTTFRDAARTTAMWVGDGACRGVILRRTSSYTPTPTQFRLAHPLVSPADPVTPEGCHFQMRYEATMHGAVPGEKIVGMRWAPQSGFVFASTYSDMTISMAPFSREAWRPLSMTFSDNRGAAPTVVYQGDYDMPNATGVQWFDWPAFSPAFVVTPDPLIFEVDLPAGGTTFQLFRHRSIQGEVGPMHNRNLANSGRNQAVNPPEETFYWAQFDIVTDRSLATSLFWDTRLENPQYGEAIVEQTVLPGTTIVMAFQGGRDDDGDGVPEIESTWTDDASTLSGYRFVRFRIELDGAHVGGQVPVVQSVEIPVIDP